MAKWNCICGFTRKLRSDGIVESCPACAAPEHDAFREAIGLPTEPEFIDEIEEV